MRFLRIAICALFLHAWIGAQAQTARVVEIPTRPGVTQRFLYVAPDKPKATAVIFPGGAGEIQVDADAKIEHQAGNFLVRSRDLVDERGIAVAIVAPPSGRTNLGYFRDTREHAEDVRAVITWLRRQAAVPVWLIGTSRSTVSAGYVATALAPKDGGPDGVVLTSSV